MSINVVFDSASLRDDAEKFCMGFGYAPPQPAPDKHRLGEYSLHFSEGGTYLAWQENKKKPVTLCVDFVAGANAHRRHFGGGKGQSIAKAVGVQPKFKPSILDCTAGQGGDAFVFATLGCKVKMLERSPIAYALLCSALDGMLHSVDSTQAGLDTGICVGEADYQAGSDEGLDEELQAIRRRLSLIYSDAASYLKEHIEEHDVVYLDPMFPERKKSAAVKKEMRVFHDLIGSDDDAEQLLSLAMSRARYRTVVKRSKLAPFLANQTPSYSLKGKSTRFDIYVNKALPKF